jgi:Phytanoyl-CoA dioxygenase (PhyH)
MSPGLTSSEMAHFVARGFLRYDALLGPAACETLLADVASGRDAEGCQYGMRLADAWPRADGIRAIFSEPRLRNVVFGLLGDDPVYDHHFPHVTEPGHHQGDGLHQDAIYDRRRFAFDVQLSIFPQETTREMGGTLIVPGSHLRRVNEGDIARYQHITGQEQLVCPAGTVILWHNNLWPSGRTNRSAARRTMFKVRLQPRLPQFRTWHVADDDALEVFRILGETEPWHGVDGRIEVMNRLALFRYLSGREPGPSAPHFGHYFAREG